MAASTTPILVAGGVTVANRLVFQAGSMDWKIPIATGFAVLAFAGLEASPGIGKAVVGIAWIAALTAMALPGPNGKSFLDNVNNWINPSSTTGGKKK